MKLAATLALLAAGVVATAGVAAGIAMPGVEKPARAHSNWILKCQGCHRADASGTPQTTPAMAGIIGTFLKTPEGRDYLARVPGVASAALPDAELAELLNWTLLRFDPAHVPKDFKPYTPNEVGQLRSRPLRTEAAQTRARILAEIEGGGGTE
ncbi:MAG: cytochrome C [Sphingobium sp.]|jgi:cytochrome c2